MYIAADGSTHGTRKNRIPYTFTHWFLCTDIEYPKVGLPAPEPKRDEVLNAIRELQKKGIIQSPDYWDENYGNLFHTGRLLVNMADYCRKGG